MLSGGCNCSWFKQFHFMASSQAGWWQCKEFMHMSILCCSNSCRIKKSMLCPTVWNSRGVILIVIIADFLLLFLFSLPVKNTFYAKETITRAIASYHQINQHFPLPAKMSGTQRRTLISPWRMHRTYYSMPKCEQWKYRVCS